MQCNIYNIYNYSILYKGKCKYHDHEWHLAIPAIPPLSFRKASRSSSWALESLFDTPLDVWRSERIPYLNNSEWYHFHWTSEKVVTTMKCHTYTPNPWQYPFYSCRFSYSFLFCIVHKSVEQLSFLWKYSLSFCNGWGLWQYMGHFGHDSNVSGIATASSDKVNTYKQICVNMARRYVVECLKTWLILLAIQYGTSNAFVYNTLFGEQWT